MGYPARRGSRTTTAINGLSGTATLPPRQVGDLLLVWSSSMGTTTLTETNGWSKLMAGSNPGVAGSASGFTGAIWAKLATTASATADSETVFTSSVAVQHSMQAEAITNHKLTAISQIKLTATAAGNLSGSGSITYGAFGTNSLVSSDEYLMYGMVTGRNNTVDKAPTSVSSGWGSRESFASGLTASDTFVSTQSRQITGVTSLTINSHAATNATGYWASASIAIPGATASPPPTVSAVSEVDFSATAVTRAPAVGAKQVSAVSSVDFSATAVTKSVRQASAVSQVEFTATAVTQRPGQVVGTTPPTQADMPEVPFSLYTAPGMEWLVGSPPSGTGYVAVGTGTEYTRLVHAGAKGTIAGSVPGFVTASPLQDISTAGTGTNPLVYPPIGIRVRTDSPVVYIRLGQRSYSGFSNVNARASTRLKVNGKWTSVTPVYMGTVPGYPSNPDNITAGEYALKLTFPDSQTRDIELTTHLEFGGVVIPAGYWLYTPEAPKHTLAIIGGSLDGAEKHQTGNFALNGSEGSGAQATYTAVTSHIWTAAQALAYDSVINSATGSSGFGVNGDSVAYRVTDKVEKDLIEHQPDMIVVGSANNDQAVGRSVSTVNADAQTVYSRISSLAKPGAIKVAMGMFSAPAMGTQAQGEAAVAPYNDAMMITARNNGFWFINPATGQTFDPQGNVVKTTSNWVYAQISEISSDNTHPTQKGAHTLGQRFADAIKPAHALGSTPTFQPLSKDRGAQGWNQKYRGALSRKAKYRGSDTKISTW